MSSSVNKVIIVGNLGGDPELRYTPNGKAVASFNVATSESFGSGEGREERTEWHRIVVWDRLAELCGQYLAKGRKVYLEGRLQTRQWTDKDNQKRSTTEIVAREVVFLSGGDSQGQGRGNFQRDRGPRDEGEGGYNAPRGQGRNAPPQHEDPAPAPFNDDDIPF